MIAVIVFIVIALIKLVYYCFIPSIKVKEGTMEFLQKEGSADIDITEYSEEILKKKIESLKNENSEIKNILTEHDSSFNLDTIGQNDLSHLLSEMLRVSNTHYVSESMRSDLIRKIIATVSNDPKLFKAIRYKNDLKLDTTFFNPSVVDEIKKSKSDQEAIMKNGKSLLNYDYLVSMKDNYKKMLEICKLLNDNGVVSSTTEQALILLYALMPFRKVKKHTCGLAYIDSKKKEMSSSDNSKKVIDNYQYHKKYITDLLLKDFELKEHFTAQVDGCSTLQGKIEGGTKEKEKRKAEARQTTTSAKQTTTPARQTTTSAKQTTTPARQTTTSARQTTTPAKQTKASTKQTVTATAPVLDKLPFKVIIPDYILDKSKVPATALQGVIIHDKNKTHEAIASLIYAENKKEEDYLKLYDMYNVLGEGGHNFLNAFITKNYNDKNEPHPYFVEIVKSIYIKIYSLIRDVPTSEVNYIVLYNLLKGIDVKNLTDFINDEYQTNIQPEEFEKSNMIVNLVFKKGKSDEEYDLLYNLNKELSKEQASALFKFLVNEYDDTNAINIYNAEIEKAGEIVISNISTPTSISSSTPTSISSSFLTTKFDDGFWPRLNINPLFKVDNNLSEYKSRDYELIRPVINFVDRGNPAGDGKSADFVNNILTNKNFNKIRDENIHPILVSLNDKALNMLIRYIINQETLVKLMSLDVKCLKEFAPKLAALRKEISDMSVMKEKLIELESINDNLKKCRSEKEGLLEESRQEVKKSKDLQDKINDLEEQIQQISIDMEDLTKTNKKLLADNLRTKDIKSDKINAITEEKATLEKDKKDLLDRNKQLISLSAEVNSELDRSKAIVAKLRGELQLTNEELNEANLARKKIEERLKDLQADYAYLEKREEAVSNLIKESSTIRLGLIGFNKNIKMLTDRMEKLIMRIIETNSGKSKRQTTEILKSIDKLKSTITAVSSISSNIDSISDIIKTSGKANNIANKDLSDKLKEAEDKNKQIKENLGMFLASNGMGFEYMKTHIQQLSDRRDKIMNSLNSEVNVSDRINADKVDVADRIDNMRALEEINNEIYAQENIVRRYNQFVTNVFKEFQVVNFTMPKKSRDLIDEYKYLLTHYKKNYKNITHGTEMIRILRTKNSEIEEQLNTLTKENKILTASLGDGLADTLKKEIQSLNQKIIDLTTKGEIINYKELEVKMQTSEDENKALRDEYNDLLDKYNTEKTQWALALNDSINNYGDELSTELDQMMEVLQISTDNSWDTNNVEYANIKKKQMFILSKVRELVEELKKAKENEAISAEELARIKEEYSSATKKIAIQDSTILELRKLAGETIASVEPVKTITESLQEENEKLRRFKDLTNQQLEMARQQLIAAKSASPENINNVLQSLLASLSLPLSSSISSASVFKEMTPWATKMAFVINYMKELNEENPKSANWKTKVLSAVKLANKVGNGPDDNQTSAVELDDTQTDDVGPYESNANDNDNEYDIFDTDNQGDGRSAPSQSDLFDTDNQGDGRSAPSQPDPFGADNTNGAVLNKSDVSKKTMIQEANGNLSAIEKQRLDKLAFDNNLNDISLENAQVVTTYIMDFMGLVEKDEEYEKKVLPLYEKYRMKELYPDDILKECKLVSKVDTSFNTKSQQILIEDEKYYLLPLANIAGDLIKYILDVKPSNAIAVELLAPSPISRYDMILAGGLAAHKKLREQDSLIRVTTSSLERLDKSLKSMISDMVNVIKGNSYFTSKIQSLIGSANNTPQDLLIALEEKLNSKGDATFLKERLAKYKTDFNILDSSVLKSIESINESIRKINLIKSKEKADADKLAELNKELDLMKSLNQEDAIKLLESEKAELIRSNEDIADKLAKTEADLKVNKELREMQLQDDFTVKAIEFNLRNLQEKLYERLADKTNIDKENSESILARLDEETNGVSKNVKSLESQLAELRESATANISKDSNALIVKVTEKIKEVIDILPGPKINIIMELLDEVTKKWKNNSVNISKYVTLNKALEEKLLEQAGTMSSMSDEIGKLQKSQEVLDAYKLVYSIMSNDEILLGKINEDFVNQKKSFAADLVQKIKLAAESIPKLSTDIELIKASSNEVKINLSNKIAEEQAKVNELRSELDKIMSEKSKFIEISDKMSSAGTLSMVTISKINEMFKQHKDDIAKLSLSTGDILKAVDNMKLKLDDLLKLQPINQKQKDELALAISELKATQLLEKQQTAENVLKSIGVITSATERINSLAYLVGKMPSRITSLTKVNDLKASIKDSLSDTTLQSLLMKLEPNDLKRAKLIEAIKNIVGSECTPVVQYEEIYYQVPSKKY